MFAVVTIVDAADKPTGAVWGWDGSALFELGGPLTSHEGYTMLRMTEKVFGNWFAARLVMLKNLKDNFG